MEPAATCEITALDDAGRPLPGATVAFWPNVLWGGRGSTVFANGVFNTEDFLRVQPNREAMRAMTRNDFRAVGDERGVALVRNLPAGHQSYRVSHTTYDMPIQRTGNSQGRSASITLSPGETGRVTVGMQRKGTESLTH